MNTHHVYYTYTDARMQAPRHTGNSSRRTDAGTHGWTRLHRRTRASAHAALATPNLPTKITPTKIR